MKKAPFLLIVLWLCTALQATTISLQQEGETIKVYPNSTLTLYVVTDVPLIGFDLIVNVTADANIIAAVGPGDSDSYGWQPGFTFEPIFAADHKEVEMGGNAGGGINYNSVIAYAQIACGSSDTVVSIAEGLYFGGSMDLNYEYPVFSNGLVTVSPYSGPLLTLRIEVEPNDIGIDTITPGPGEHQYYETEVVSLSAELFTACPDVYRLDHWAGDGIAEPNDAETTVQIDAEKTITAVYAAEERRCGDECHPILGGDLNGNCYVDFEDFKIYCELWLACTHPDCD
jgi:hypothetical protein